MTFKKQYLWDGHHYNVRSVPNHHSETQRYEIRGAVDQAVVGYVAWDLEYIISYDAINQYQGVSIHENWVDSFDEAILWGIGELVY